MFCAFDILVSEGEDLRKLPLHLRKKQPCAASGQAR
jgi:ATP-dependent DNA ligase